MPETWQRAPVALAVLLTGCGLLDVGLANEITRIEPVSVRIEVVEFGALDPQRIAIPSTSPVAEVLPGDRVRLEIEVVDVDGLALADDRLDSLWLVLPGPLLSGPEQLTDPALERRCDELDDWTLDSGCRLEGNGASVEFEVPPLGEAFRSTVGIWVVLAWDGRRASDCWAERLARDVVLERCDFVRATVLIGPLWFWLAHVANEGVPLPEYLSGFEVDRLPTSVFTQQANRAPQTVLVDITLEGGDGQGWGVVDGVAGPIPVNPGDLLRIDVTVDQVLQFGQAQFVPLHENLDLFTILPEQISKRFRTTGSIEAFFQDVLPQGAWIEVQVDDDARPGIARVLIAVNDGRGSEQLVRVELDVQ